MADGDIQEQVLKLGTAGNQLLRRPGKLADKGLWPEYLG
jgi:hypothetical protein